MRKFILLLTLVSSLLSITNFTGCSSTKNIGGVDVPKWVMEEPKSKAGTYAVGNANLGAFQMSFDAAISNAKANLMQKIKSESNDTIKLRASGADGKSSSGYERETVHNSSMALENVEIVEKYMSKDGTAWVLLFLPK